MPLVSVLSPCNLNLFLGLCHVDVSDGGVLTIEDRGDLLESRPSSLDEDEVDPDRFNDIPTLQTRGVLENRDQKDVRSVEERGAYGIEDPEIIGLLQPVNGKIVRLS